MNAKRLPAVLFAVLSAVCLVPVSSAAQWAEADPRVEQLLARMTLEEKVGEMTQLTLSALAKERSRGEPYALDPVKLENAIVHHNVGSVLNVWSNAHTMDEWHDVIYTLQNAARRKRLQIPVLYGIDAVHGHNYLFGATLFPQNLAMAATWNPELLRRANEITAAEMRASGIRWNFSPVLDLGRQPAWSRFFETFGEDVHLSMVMGEAVVRGLQGTDVTRTGRVAATGKHFLGYSMPRSGRDRTPAWIPKRMLYEYFVPPFRAAIDAGARTIMLNSADINLVPVHASREIVTDLLRDELGFRGVVVSDWEDIIRLHTVHRVAATPKEAVRMAIDAGIDMSMVPYNLSFHEQLVELVREGSIDEARIDQSVRRILKLKFDLGLFENPFPDSMALPAVGSEESQAVSRAAAEEAITLLKNDRGVLPLRKDARVLIVGPGAHSRAALHGSWTYSWQGANEELYPPTSRTLLEAMLAQGGAERVMYVPGAVFDKAVDVDAAVAAAPFVDVVVVALAEEPSTEKPGDIDDLELPAAQLRLARALQATGKPVVMVLMVNRPRIVREIVDSARAIVLAYQPGPHGGEALADVLYGAVNPSGKLPFSYPRFPNAIVHYDHVQSEEIGPSGPEGGYDPQWPFGHGLSYTKFEYSDLQVAPLAPHAGDTLTVTVRVKNTGKRAGKEVVQLYVRDLIASVSPPVRRLRGFQKISLEPGEEKAVSFRLPLMELAFIGRDSGPTLEPGEFEVIVDEMKASFRLTSGR